MDPSSWAYYTNRLQQTQQPAAAELQQYATLLQVQQLRQVAEQQQQAQAQAQHHQVNKTLAYVKYSTRYGFFVNGIK